MRIEDIFAEGADMNAVIRQIKDEKKSLGIPKWDDLKNEYYPHLHRINRDTDFWKNRGTPRKPKPVSRVTYAMQKKATRGMTQMAFAIPVKRSYRYDSGIPAQKDIVDSIEKIYKRAHIDSVNRKRMQAYFASCELLTIWYAIPSGKHEDYGFESEYKLRCKSYSEMNGYTLYPIFDGYDDLLGMCVEYKTDEYANGAKSETYNFEVFSKDRHVHYKGSHGTVEIVPVVDEVIKIGKLPLTYMYRQSPIWEDQTGNCDEIELAYSRESEILRHNSAPYLHVAGQIGKKSGGAKTTPPPKPFSITQDGGTGAKQDNDTTDDAVRIIKTENGGTLSYVTWSQSIEAMKFFVEELKRNIEEHTQIPNLTFEKMATLGGIGYDARKTILTDAHLKVGDESGELIQFLEREWKVICAHLARMNPAYRSEIDKISCEHIISPFIQDDEKFNIEVWRSASGGEPLLSRQTALKYSGLVENVDEELTLIKNEEKAAREAERVKMVFETATD